VTFSQTGGARIGTSVFFALNATWPFARLTVKETELALSFLWWTWILPKRSIRSLRKYSGIFSTGLRIEHSAAGCPAFVVFWTFGFNALKQELERCGYAVSAA
jgi:hypothetical protein